MKRRYLNVIAGALLFCLPVLLLGTETADRYAHGLDAYQNSQYALAIQEFESVLAANWEAPELYYNLGNAYYREGAVAGAVWAFEQCLRLDPGHSDAAYNLELANVKVVDRINMPDPPLILHIYRLIKQWLTPRGWIFLFLSILLLFSITFASRKIFDLPWVIHFNWIFVPGLILVLLIGIDAISNRYSISEGIIYTPVAQAYSAPDEYATKLFEVHAGLKIQIVGSTTDWYEIELLDGNTGWIPAVGLRLLTH